MMAEFRNRLACWIAVALWLAATPALAGQADIDAGRDLARANCASCHAIGTEDASPRAEAPPFRRLHERFPVEHLAEALAEGIAVGHAAMPEFELQPGDIDALIAYLQSIAPE